MYESVSLKVTGTTVTADNTDELSQKSYDRSLLPDIMFSVVTLFIGVVLVYVAEKDMSSPIFAIIFAFLGAAIVAICKGNKYEYRAFMLSYSVCVFVMGLSFNYSLSHFGMLMSTIDSPKFIKVINDSNTTLDQLRYVINSPLPALIWKYLAAFRELVNVGGNGPGVYVLLNACLIGLTSVFITKIANEFFPGDPKRIRLVATLFALCGMSWLFGSLLIRDSYALVLNTLSIWVLVKVLVTPNLKNLILAIVVSVISAVCMWFVREKAFYLFFLFGLMALGLWYLKSKFSPAKVLMLLFLPVIAILAFDQISTHTSMATDATSAESEQYTTGASAGARSGSLGAALVVNQPLPVRLIVGSAYVLIFPIPLWGYFEIGLPEYFIIRGMHGVFMVLLIPLAIFSSIKIFGRESRRSSLSTARLFMFFYFIVTLMLVGVTTLETRHHGQFLAAFIVLAAMPLIQTQPDKNLLKRIRFSWFGMIVGGHILWALLRL